MQYENKKRGGARVGAGRPPGSGKYREQTKNIRIPLSLVPKIQEILSNFQEKS
jgi:DNA polymerase V